MKFVLKMGRVVFNENDLVVPQIAALHSLTKSGGGAALSDALTVVYLVADEDSPYSRMSEPERWSESFANCNVDKKMQDKWLVALKNAVDAYTRFNNNVYWRALRAIDDNIDALVQMLSETAPYIRKKEVTKNTGTPEEPVMITTVTFESNAKEIDEYYQRLDSFMKSREGIYRQYIQKKEADTPRGGAVAGALAAGSMRNPALSKDFKR